MPSPLAALLDSAFVKCYTYNAKFLQRGYSEMLDLVKLRSRAQVTLPKEAVKTLNLKEGDILSVEVANGKVIMTPVAVIPRDELWAWSSKMRGVIEKSRLEAKEGNLKGYDSVEELWQDLHVAEGEADDL